MSQSSPAELGRRIRVERQRQKMSLRELARRIGVTASLISQIENGKTRPSVSTLYSIVTELKLSMDELYDDTQGAANGPVAIKRRGEAFLAASGSTGGEPLEPLVQYTATVSPYLQPFSPVQREANRKVIHLDSGVRWERLTPTTERGVDFLYTVYEIGGASSLSKEMTRHPGREYLLVLRGLLGISVGFDEYMLEPGDSIAFDSMTPHRLWNAGQEPVHSVVFVFGRDGSNPLLHTPGSD